MPEVFVKAIVWEADGVISLDLRPSDGGALPAFTAGAHIDLHLPEGMRRSYSLANDQTETHRYLIAVQRDAASRGGSRFVHDSIRVGQRLTIDPPRNNFALDETGERFVLIAGGIGITPMLCMSRRLAALGRPMSLYYAARTRSRAAFLDDLPAAHLHFDDEQGGAVLDIAAIVGGSAEGTHFYCCGPLPMLAAFEGATAHLPPDRVHVEYFMAREPVQAEGGFEVVLARANRTIAVPEKTTILDALLAAGIDAGHSCLEGVCGTCETRVLDGIPDHRDSVLTTRERAANKTIMICCSGAKTPRLVLDL